MGVVRTDKWLQDSYDNPIELCEKLTAFFDDISASEIHDYLMQYGMYHRSSDKEKQVDKLLKNRTWKIIHMEKQRLQKVWDCPDVPIFIFPSDTSNKELMRDHNGKSGLAFKDKLFLFVSGDNTEEEIRALFTHEYNHVCRLSHFSKSEMDYTLLDTIILEGLAENAVRERLGDAYTATWTTYYSEEKLQNIWERVVRPNRRIPRSLRKQQEILYGLRFYPKMAGYCVGYYLVKKYMKEKGLTSKDLLDLPAGEIAQIN